MDDAYGRLLRAAGLPVAGGVPASMIVTVTADQLAARSGSGETTDGTLLTAEQLARVAGEADLWNLITSATGTPLHLGRTRRIASLGQTVALIARDGGCSFPGCTHPPPWCDRHHVQEWVDGGPTDIANLTLLCRYHPTHFAMRGWAVTINRDGLPAWIPPGWVDRAQRPQLHPRILRRRLQLAA